MNNFSPDAQPAEANMSAVPVAPDPAAMTANILRQIIESWRTPAVPTH